MTNTRIRVMLYSQQPFVARGLETVLNARPEFELVASAASHQSALDALRTTDPDVTLAFFTDGVSLSDLRQLRAANPRKPLVLWGDALAVEFVFQGMQLGIRGLLLGDTSSDALLAALERVHQGELCFEASLMESLLLHKRVVLSPRETRIVALVAQGLKNKEIAYTLGLSEGTVKVYLSRIFRKLDMNDRLDLALYGLKNLFGGQTGIDRSGAARGSRTATDLACLRSLPLRPREPVGIRLPN